MATRCFIGKALPNGNITGIYCHSDGYPGYTGLRLEAHYTDSAKIDALLALGDISILGDEIGEKHNFDDYETHRDWTKAYHRDRGEGLNPNRMYESLEVMEENVGSDIGAEWAYVWTGDQWATIKLP
jgi:hypothetical protein